MRQTINKMRITINKIGSTDLTAWSSSPEEVGYRGDIYYRGQWLGRAYVYEKRNGDVVAKFTDDLEAPATVLEKTSFSLTS